MKTSAVATGMFMLCGLIASSKADIVVDTVTANPASVSIMCGMFVDVEITITGHGSTPTVPFQFWMRGVADIPAPNLMQLPQLQNSSSNLVNGNWQTTRTVRFECTESPECAVKMPVESTGLTVPSGTQILVKVWPAGTPEADAVYAPVTVRCVPEPSTFVALGIGSIALLAARRRKKS